MSIVPDATNLGELFDDIRPYDKSDGDKGRKLILHSEGFIIETDNVPKGVPWMTIGTYLMIRSGEGMPDDFPKHQSLCVIPNKRLLEALLDNLVFVEYDTIHFELDVFNDKSHLYYKHSQILGGRKITENLYLNGGVLDALVSLSSLSD